MVKSKIRTPRVENHLTLQQHAAIAANQRKYCNDLADRVERLKRGEDLTEWEKDWIAGCLRAWAKLIPDLPKRKPGQRRQPPKLLPGNTAVEHLLLRLQNVRATKAIDTLADHYDVSSQAVRDAIRKGSTKARGKAAR